MPTRGYLIYCRVNDKQGTAFWISKTRAVTAFHLLERLSREQRTGVDPFPMYVQTGEFTGDTVWRVIAHNPAHDVAVIELQQVAESG